eukprot:3439662-Amphidinium_carterae.1
MEFTTRQTELTLDVVQVDSVNRLKFEDTVVDLICLSLWEITFEDGSARSHETLQHTVLSLQACEFGLSVNLVEAMNGFGMYGSS